MSAVNERPSLLPILWALGRSVGTAGAMTREPAAGPQGAPRRRRGGVREAHRELTRARLVDAAVECFSAAGFVATTIDDITAAAGTTRATFYLHFASKGEVMLDVLRWHGAEYEHVFAELAALAERPTRDGIRNWLASTLQVWDRMRSAAMALTEAAALEGQVQQARLASYERDIDMLAAALQKGGRWDTGGAKVRAVLLLSQLEQLFQRWSVQGWDVDRDEAVAVMTEMWAAALDVRGD